MTKYLPFLLPLSFCVLLFACDTKSCDNVVCNGPNEICSEGKCVCTQGYEGDFCDEYSYVKYIGTYNISQNCTTTTNGSTNDFYTASISNGGAIDQIVLNNFFQGYTVDAYINANYIRIPAQTVFGSASISGEGEYFPNLNRMTINFEVTQGSTFSQCTAIFTKL